MPNPIRVAVVDDHPKFRDGAIRMLMAADGFVVVGEGSTAADALKIAQENGPDVVLLDLRLPGGGVEAIVGITSTCPNVRTIVLTVSENERDVTAALRAGVLGYIVKGGSGDEVVDTVRAVVRGDFYVAPKLTARFLITDGKRVEAVSQP